MPKNVHTYMVKRGNISFCPLCDYKLPNNQIGLRLHMKASHNMAARLNPEKTKDIVVCFCGKKNCEKFKVHTAGK